MVKKKGISLGKRTAQLLVLKYNPQNKRGGSAKLDKC